MRVTMFTIVRLFLLGIISFCLTISLVWADDVQILPAKEVVDYSTVAEHVYQQQAEFWLLACFMAIFLGFMGHVLLNTRIKSKDVLATKDHAGDVAAKNVSLVWLIFMVLLMAGFAVPALRLWLVL